MEHPASRIRCSVGVTAHNEAANIGALLDALINQHLYQAEISEIIVVASGCTDDTVPIIERKLAEDERIRLIVQPRRECKTSAINLFLQAATEAICVLESGDTLPREDAVEHMVRMFADPNVGMTGAHLHVDHAGGLPGLFKARAVSNRGPVDFKIFGPAGRRALDADDADFPATSRFIDLLFGKQGAFGYLKDFSPPLRMTAGSFSVRAVFSGAGSRSGRG